MRNEKLKLSFCKKSIGWLIGVILLVGCGGAPDITGSTPLPTPTLASVTASPLPTPSEQEGKAQLTTEALENQGLPPVPPGCTVVSKQFSPEPTQPSIFPAVSAADWSVGPETAAVTLIEYGDFQ